MNKINHIIKWMHRFMQFSFKFRHKQLTTRATTKNKDIKRIAAQQVTLKTLYILSLHYLHISSCDKKRLYMQIKDCAENNLMSGCKTLQGWTINHKVREGLS
jgi:hypothetical protein